MSEFDETPDQEQPLEDEEQFSDEQQSSNDEHSTVTDTIIGAAPENVREAAEKARRAKEVFQKIKALAHTTKTLAVSFVKTLMNPISWIIIAVVIVVVALVITFMSASQVIGRNENADGCYGIGGSSGSSSLQMDDSSDWTGRANSAGQWLMSNSFAFLGGKPMNRNQTAAVLGNFIAESGITFAKAELKGPNANGSLNKMDNEAADSFTKNYAPAGLGLAQWTWNPGRAGTLLSLAKSMGKQWYEPEVQLTMIKNELDSSYGANLLAAGFNDSSKSVDDLTTIFHNVYEGSADKTMTKRQQAAKDFLAVFNGSTSGMTGGSCVMAASDVDNSDVVQLAISLSYPTTAESKVGPGDWTGASKAKPEYKKAKAEAEAKTGKDPSGALYASCDRFVATVTKLTMDPSIPWGSTSTQQAYLASSPKWKQYTKKSEAQPGDIWVTRTNGHIILYIGNYKGVDSIAHASYLDRVAGIGSSSYLNENLVDTNGRAYYGYHFVGSK